MTEIPRGIVVPASCPDTLLKAMVTGCRPMLTLKLLLDSCDNRIPRYSLLKCERSTVGHGDDLLEEMLLLPLPSPVHKRFRIAQIVHLQASLAISRSVGLSDVLRGSFVCRIEYNGIAFPRQRLHTIIQVCQRITNGRHKTVDVLL